MLALQATGRIAAMLLRAAADGLRQRAQRFPSIALRSRQARGAPGLHICNNTPARIGPRAPARPLRVAAARARPHAPNRINFLACGSPGERPAKMVACGPKPPL